MSMTLYAAPLSSATPVVHALCELEIPHEVVLLDLLAGDQHQPEFRALNPNAQVPTLVVDGAPIFEALAILQWLGDRFGLARGLWPAAEDPARLEALSWSTWAYVTFGSALKRFLQATGARVPEALRHPVQAKHTQDELQGLLGLLDARLAARRFLLGDDFTLVDLIVASVVSYGAHCGVSTDGHAGVEAWLERFHARPAYQKAWAPAAG
ncbi:MAG: glutathione S-transferase family protein [Myxococcales bacterium]|nr:glutathione S-transferase family protein [Myxococcales bacterium]